MTNNIAIKVSNVSKTFKLPHEKQNSIKGLFVNMFSRKRTYEKQQVLKNISFEIKKGEFFGIVGRNGSGKSTLLKLLAGIYIPDSGHIQVNGKLTPFIELGVGFNPELTGRENVFLNGALLGFSRKEILDMYDEIVEFAELEKFMDQKLKNYSSGMQVRLAFSIAIRANTEILLLDEVLAVGDEAFQRKCFDYFDELKRNHKTVVLVTHDMSAVDRFCDKALLLEEGDVIKMGRPSHVSAMYTRSNEENYRPDFSNNKKKNPEITIKLLDKNNKENKKFTHGDDMRVSVGWNRDDVEHVGVAIFTRAGQYVYGTNTFLENVNIKNKKEVEYVVDLNLGKGTYFVQIGLFGARAEEKLVFEEDGPSFVVNPDPSDSKWVGLTLLEHIWR